MEGALAIDGNEDAQPLDRPFICPAIIGRARERTLLHARIADAIRRQGRTVLISGEAGVGKSRLAAEAKRIALAQGYQIAQGQCFQPDAAYPYAPLLDLLRTYLPDRLSAIATNEREPLLHGLAQLLPDVALILPDFPAPSQLVASQPADVVRHRHQLHVLLTEFLISQATISPLLLVIEDAHWCDESTLDVLLQLARRVPGVSLLLVVTFRRDDTPAHVSRWLAQLDRKRLAQDVELAPLSQPEVDAMVRAILATDHLKSARLSQAIYRMTEGNPFFVEEVLKSLIATGALRSLDGVWRYMPGRHMGDNGAALVPRSVAEIVRQRVAGLSPDARQALTLAAVAGRRFDFAVLQRLMACDEQHLIALVKELIGAQLLVEETADCFAFRHALLRQSVYGGLLARERRTLHHAVAEALEALYAAPAEREAHLTDLSTHFSASGSWAKALEYEQLAAEKALMLYAPRAAIEHATQALGAARRLDIAPPGRVYYLRGQAHETLGAFDRARGDYERALERAELATDDTLQWQSMTALGFLWTERDYHQAGIWFRRASDLADRLDDPAMQARSLNRMGNWLTNTGRLDEALRAHQDALKIFEGHDNRQGIAETLDLLSTLHGMRGDRITAVEELGRAIVLFRALGDTPGLVSSLAMRALQAIPGANETTYCPRRSRNECVRDAAESLRLAHQTGSQPGQAFAEMVLAHVLISFGEFGPALLHAQTAQHIASMIGHQQWMVSTLYGLGRVHVLLLAPSPAISALTTGLALAQELGSELWVALLASCQARAHVLNYDLPAAQATLQLVMPCEQRPRTIAERNVALAWSELALAQREYDVALHIAEHLLATAPGQASGQTVQIIPDLLWVKGEALLGLSRPDEATAALEAARRGAQERNARPLLWKIHRSLGRGYQLLRRQDEAQQEFAAARRLIDELASTIADDSLRDHFVQTAMASLPKGRASQGSTRQAFDGLTAREHEVAALVAEGKTNRQIADALVVSERTAEVHVSNILRKLEFTSRAQIAVWAVGRGRAKG
jgi:DNA-binding CsgD family transcriptional regulator